MRATKPTSPAETPFASTLLLLVALMATAAVVAAGVLFLHAREKSWVVVATLGLMLAALLGIVALTAALVRPIGRRSLRLLLAVVILAPSGALAGWLAARWLEPSGTAAYLDRGLWWGIALGFVTGWRPALRRSRTSAI